MKPFAELTIDDFRRAPVWRYESQGDDATAKVEEVAVSYLSELDPGVFVVATTYRLADGSEFLGLCSPIDPSGLDYLQPILFFEGDQVPLWSGAAAAAVAPELVAKQLRRPVSGVFPLAFTCHILVDGDPISGVIDAAGALPNQALQLTVRLPPLGRSDDRR